MFSCCQCDEKGGEVTKFPDSLDEGLHYVPGGISEMKDPLCATEMKDQNDAEPPPASARSANSAPPSARSWTDEDRLREKCRLEKLVKEFVPLLVSSLQCT